MTTPPLGSLQQFAGKGLLQTVLDLPGNQAAGEPKGTVPLEVLLERRAFALSAGPTSLAYSKSATAEASLDLCPHQGRLALRDLGHKGPALKAAGEDPVTPWLVDGHPKALQSTG